MLAFIAVFLTALVSLVYAAPSAYIRAAPGTVPLTYDPTYDNPKQSLATVSCSNGPNGLLTKGYTTFDSLPSFPYIGGSFHVEGFNSAKCGACIKLTYINRVYENKTIHVTVIDHATNGLNIGLQANNELTSGDGAFFGTVQVIEVEVDKSNCGF